MSGTFFLKVEVDFSALHFPFIFSGETVLDGPADPLAFLLMAHSIIMRFALCNLMI